MRPGYGEIIYNVAFIRDSDAACHINSILYHCDAVVLSRSGQRCGTSAEAGAEDSQISRATGGTHGLQGHHARTRDDLDHSCERCRRRRLSGGRFCLRSRLCRDDAGCR